jgi:hypothetical protein
LLTSHPAEVKAAHAPLLALLTDLMTEAGGAEVWEFCSSGFAKCGEARA